MRHPLIILCLFIIGVCGYVEAGVKDDIKKTIVRVKSGNKYATGFFYKNGRQIITTLHSIGNPNNIEVYISGQSTWCKVQLKKVSKRADLVLLELTQCESPHYISDQNLTNPALDTKVFTVGYNGTNDKFQDRDFTVGLLEGTRLKDLLPPSAEQEIKTLGFPSLDTEIVYLKGQLLHGFSGSPIVDFNGKLVGIADGGLQNGAAGISWCVTSKSLKTIDTSTDTFPKGSLNQVNTLFAAEEAYSSGISITNGTYTFQKVKTRTFAELNETGNYTDYPELGMYQVITTLENEGISYQQFKFDIYIEASTGATVVLPAGLKLQQQDGFFYAMTQDEQQSVLIGLFSTYNLQQTALEFENVIQAVTGIYTWQQDTRLSFMIPYYRPDNVIINRKAFFNYTPNRYLFEALAGKENTFFGVAIMLNDSFNTMTYEFYNDQQAAYWLLASQLTTFTN